MNWHFLWVAARYSMRLSVRSWLFRFFIVFSFLGIATYHIVAQSNVVLWNKSGLITMASFIPYMNAYIYTLLQAFPVIFLVGAFFNQAYRLHSLEVIYARPESNAEYIAGHALGLVGLLLLCGGFFALLGVFVHLFLSAAPFSFYPYLFYLLTLTFPTLVFVVGLSFFVFAWVRHQGLGLLLLLGYAFFNLFYLGRMGQGVFDFWGITLPNTFSDITGHPGIGRYLLQRGCWLFIGMGFIGVAIRHFRRLPNRPHWTAYRTALSSFFFLIGVCFGGTFYWQHHRTVMLREVYAEVYNQYNRSEERRVGKECRSRWSPYH